MCQRYSTSQSRYRVDIDNHMNCKHIQANGFLEAIPCLESTAMNFRKCVYGFHDVSRVLIPRVWQHFPVLSALTVLKMGICLNLTNADAKLFGKHLKHARELLNDIIAKAAMKYFNTYEWIRTYATIVDSRMMLLTCGKPVLRSPFKLTTRTARTARAPSADSRCPKRSPSFHWPSINGWVNLGSMHNSNGFGATPQISIPMSG